MVRFGGGAHDGDEVDVCIMCAEAKARAFRPSDAEFSLFCCHNFGDLIIWLFGLYRFI